MSLAAIDSYRHNFSAVGQNPTYEANEPLTDSLLSSAAEEVLTPEHFWNFIDNHFTALGEVFLQVKHYENRRPIAFNGRLVIEINDSKGTFVNYAKATLAALNGLVIRALKIKNRGSLLTNGVMEFKARYVDNSKGHISANEDVLIDSPDFHNVAGAVLSQTGIVKWISGHHANLDNTDGILNAKQSVTIVNRHKIPSNRPRALGRILINKSGKIISSNSCVLIHVDAFHNSQGILRGKEGDILVNSFDNRNGKLLMSDNGRIFVADAFDNEKGLIVIGGVLTACEGNWKNADGRIGAALGLDAQVKSFDNSKEGMIFSSKGKVQLITQKNLQQHGRIDAAEGITLLSQEGSVWAQEGVLIAPSKKIAVNSPQHYLDITRGNIQGGELEAFAYEQIGLMHATVKVKGQITFNSKTGWIDAQHAVLASDHNNLIFKAPNKSLYLDHSYVKTGNQLILHAKHVDVENSRFDVKSDIDFVGERFKSSKSSFYVENGNVVLNGARSLNRSQGVIRVSHGKLLESSEGWIFGKDEQSIAGEIGRSAAEISLQENNEKAAKIMNIASQHLALLRYGADASETIILSSAGDSYFNDVRLESKNIEIKMNVLWLEEVNARFEQMQIQTHEGCIQESKFTGESLSAQSKESLSITHNNINSKTIRLKAKKNLSLTNSKIQGSLLLKSETHQHIANNVFGKGNFKLTSEHGDALLENNAFMEMASVETATPEGTTEIVGSTIEAEEISGKAKKLIVRTGKIHSKGKLKLKAKRIKVQNLQLKAEKVNVKGSKRLDVENSDIKGKQVHFQGNSFFDGSHLYSKQQLKMEGEAAAFYQSQVKAKNNLMMKVKKITSHRSVFESKHIEQQAEEVQATQSTIKADKLILNVGKADLLSVAIAAETTTIASAAGVILALSSIEGKELKVDNQTGSADITATAISGAIDIHSGGDILASYARISGTAAALQAHSNLEGYRLKVDVAGPINLKSGKATLLAQANLSSQSGITIIAENLYASEMELQSGCDSQLTAIQSMHLPNTILHTASDLRIGGGHVNRDNGQIKAYSLTETGRKGISARGSCTNISDNILQCADYGTLELEDSHTYAGNRITRQAALGINHTSAESLAKEHRVNALYLDNQHGVYSGDISTNVTVFDNRHGLLKVGFGSSTFQVTSFLSDDKSHILGPGSLKIKSSDNHFQSGEVHLGGSYEAQASNFTLNGPIKAHTIILNAGQGDLTFNSPINSYFGTFTALGEIANKSYLQFYQEGTFTSHHLQNTGELKSEGVLSIHQTHYRDPGNTIAQEHLLLSSDGPIAIDQARKTPGDLSFISFYGNVISNAPLKTKGDLTLQGRNIDIGKRIDTAGRGIFRSADRLHFNRTIASFGNGIDADVGTFFSNVSHINVIGNSHIVCSNFINDASHFLVKGALTLKGQTFDNRNRVHTHSYQVQTGSYRNSFCGVNYGKKKKTYAWIHDTIIDGIANTQVEGVLELNLKGSVTNDGVICARKIQGVVGGLKNGIFSSSGRTPSRYARQPESFAADTLFRPGGEFLSREGTQLQINGKLHNRGYIQSNGPLVIQAVEIFNERRTTVESEQAINKKSWGRRGTKFVETDHLEPGGVLHGSVIDLQTAEGWNLGGVIEGESGVEITANNFSLEAKRFRNVVHLKSGNIMPWQRASGYSIRTNSIAGEITSGRNLQMNIYNAFHNKGSDVTAFGNLNLLVGNLETETLFDSYKSTEKRTWKKSEDSHTLTMREARIRTITGDLCIRSTKGDVILEGECGSYGGSATIESAGNINFRTRTLNVENTINAFSFTPTSLTNQTTEFNSILSSVPHFFAGKGSGVVIAGESIKGEAVQFSIAKDLIGKAKAIHFRDRELEHHQETDGVSLEVSFPEVTGRVGIFGQQTQWTQSLPTRFSVGGNISFEASEQSYKGCTVARLGGGAEFIGDNITFEAAVNRFSSEGSKFGLSVSVGPGGSSLGIDCQQHTNCSEKHLHQAIDLGKNLKIHAAESLTIKGVALEADEVDVLTKQAKIESLQDSLSQHQFDAALSTSGDVAFSQKSRHSMQVNAIAGIKARSHGRFQADNLELTGSTLENVEVKAQHLQHRNLHNKNNTQDFSINTNVKAIKAMKHKPTKMNSSQIQERAPSSSSMQSIKPKDNKKKSDTKDTLAVKPKKSIFEEQPSKKELPLDPPIASWADWERENLLEMIAVQRGMANISAALAYPFEKAIEFVGNELKLAGQIVQLGCHLSPSLKITCDRVANVYEDTKEVLTNLVPVSLKTEYFQWLAARKAAIESRVDYNETHLGIPRQMTTQFYADGAENLFVLGTSALFKGASTLDKIKDIGGRRQLMHSPPVRVSGSTECTGEFLKDMKEFDRLPIPKIFNDVLSEDLVVVQYHGSGAVDVNRSYRWFMPASEANKLSTVEAVMDNSALLSKWGERTHVTVARIPAGEHVEMIHGKAIKQMDPLRLEIRPGGGVQYRFRNFNPKWIVETRRLPKK
jgi:adhesin HecA-like repeat protein